MKADHYDDFAGSYEAENASSLLNAFYERPAMINLAGDVTGLDGSPAMVELARQRLGDEVPLHVADLAQPLPFADDAFDVVVASLVLHYLGDWAGPLAELRRMLTPGGRLVLSVNHPTVRMSLTPTRTTSRPGSTPRTSSSMAAKRS